LWDVSSGRRYFFREYFRKHFLEKYVWLEAFGLMFKEKPWQSILLLRLAVIPIAVSYRCWNAS
jgi:hypothetical protein